MPVEIVRNGGRIKESLHVRDGKHALRVGAHTVHHRMSDLVHIHAGLHGLARHLRDGRCRKRSIGLCRLDLNVEVLDKSWMPCQQLAHRLRAFHHETARPFPPFSIGEFGHAANALRLGIRNDFGFYRHTR